jgi:hypothetical protein
MDSYEPGLPPSRNGGESGAYPIDGSNNEYRLLETLPVEDEASMIFLFGNLDRNRVYLVSIDYSELPPDSNPSGPILDYDFIEVKKVDASRGFITDNGLVLFDKEDDELILHSFDDEEIGRYDIGNARELEFAFPPLDDDGFYMLDRRRERLFRVSNFWD